MTPVETFLLVLGIALLFFCMAYILLFCESIIRHGGKNLYLCDCCRNRCCPKQPKSDTDRIFENFWAKRKNKPWSKRKFEENRRKLEKERKEEEMRLLNRGELGKPKTGEEDHVILTF